MVEAHRGRMVAGTFAFARPADAEAVQRHMQGSVDRVKGGYATGQFHQPTIDVIEALQALTAAVTAAKPSVSINLTAWGASRVRGVLRACAERAGADSLFDVANAVRDMTAAWENGTALPGSHEGLKWLAALHEATGWRARAAEVTP